MANPTLPVLQNAHGSAMGSWGGLSNSHYGRFYIRPRQSVAYHLPKNVGFPHLTRKEEQTSPFAMFRVFRGRFLFS